MNRKKTERLKKAGTPAAILLSPPTPAKPRPTVAWDQRGHTKLFFAALSQAASIRRVQHCIYMSGNLAIRRSSVTGGGRYNHFDKASPIPRNVISSGTWEAKRLLNINIIMGKHRVPAAGILEMQVHLIQRIPSPAIIPASLKVVCKPDSEGFFPGEPQGYTLSIPNAPFGAFAPLNPEKGITIFTRNGEW